MIKKFFHAVMACGLIALVMSCEDQKFNNINVDVDKVELDHLTPDMIKVRDYVPEYAVVAHRGSTFWTPEETEAANANWDPEKSWLSPRKACAPW